MKDKILIEGTETNAAAYPNALNGPWTASIHQITHNDDRIWYVIEYTSPNYGEGKYSCTYKGGASLELMKQALADQITRVSESEVTEDTPRFGSCTYCDRKATPAGYLLSSLMPWSTEDDNYDGCRGWD